MRRFLAAVAPVVEAVVRQRAAVGITVAAAAWLAVGAARTSATLRALALLRVLRPGLLPTARRRAGRALRTLALLLRTARLTLATVEPAHCTSRKRPRLTCS